MTIEEMKKKKQERGYTYMQIAELSGVPLGTVQKIFTGETQSPRYDTLKALDELFTEALAVRETGAYQVNPPSQGNYTLEDYYTLPDDKRVELIDGYFYDMAAPSTHHQLLAGEIHRQIANYIFENGGDCIPFISPVDVQLDCDEKTMVQPDVAILCDRKKLKHRAIYGAPDFVLEVISDSTKSKDYMKKLEKYRKAGVREYWIVDPKQKVVIVYYFESEACPMIYGIDQAVPVNIYQGNLEIVLSKLAQWLDEQEE